MTEFLFFVVFLLLILFVLVGVSFLVLLERTLLGYMHILKGPSRVGFVGLFQTFRDVIKLLTREQYFSLVSNFI
jgi:NADH:ubiquinone oxidoreductase subunit H